MAKTKKRVKNSRYRLKTKEDSALEEYIGKLIEKQSETEIKQSIDVIVKKEKPKEKAEKAQAAKKKNRKPVKNIYEKPKDNYKALHGSGVYDQIKFSPFVGLLYKSNIKENSEFYSHLIDAQKAIETIESPGEKNIASSEMMECYAQKFTLNFLIGTDMNPISVEEKELVFFNLYDPTQKHIYLAKIALLGFGHEKTMHALIE